MPFTQHAPIGAAHTRIETMMRAESTPRVPLQVGPDRVAAFLELPLDALGLTKRSANALFRAGLRHVFEILDWTERDLRSLPSFGPASVQTLRQALSDYGLDLRQLQPLHKAKGS